MYLCKECQKYIRVFEIAVRGVCVCGGGGEGGVGWGKGVLEILLGEIFLPGEGNLRRSDFEDLNLFQS